MTKLYTITRQCAGSYQMQAHGRTVLICRVDEWAGAAKWHWRDESARDCYGDPVMTKGDAIADALAYTANRAANPDAWR